MLITDSKREKKKMMTQSLQRKSKLQIPEKFQWLKLCIFPFQSLLEYVACKKCPAFQRSFVFKPVWVHEECIRSSQCGSAVAKQTRICEHLGSIPGPAQQVKYPALLSCLVVCSHSSDSSLLWRWCRPAAAAPIRLLACQPGNFHTPWVWS